MDPFPGEAERGVREHLAAAHALTAQIGQVQGEGSDDDGLVKAVMAPGGKVVSLTLDPRCMRMASHALAEQIVSALEAARADVDRKITEATVDAFRTNPSWAELLSGEAPVDMAAALPPLPENETFEEMLRAARPTDGRS